MKKLDTFCSKIEALTFLVNRVLINIDQPSNEQPNAFLYTIAFKTNNSLNTANLLIANVINKPHYCDSLFLILRTTLSDAITYFYLSTIGHDEIKGDDIFIEGIKRLEADHLRFSYNNLRLFQLLYKETEASIEEKRAITRNKFPNYFNTDGSFKKEFRMENMAEMITTIAKSDLDFIILPTTNAFELYDRFSKYEHLGMLTPQLVTRQFDEENHVQILGEIYCAVKTIILLQSSLLIPFLTPEEMTVFEKLTSEIKAIRVCKLNCVTHPASPAPAGAGLAG